MDYAISMLYLSPPTRATEVNKHRGQDSHGFYREMKKNRDRRFKG
jgi:hypothetical protein